MAVNEKELLKMLSSNKNEAYKYLYDHYYTPLVLFADHYVSNQEISHDLVQEVFIALLDVKINFQNFWHLKSYLYNTLRNKCINYLRHEKIKLEFIQDELYQTDEFFEEKVLEEDVYSILIAAINMLPTQSKKVMTLVIDGLTNSDIANQLDLSIETVKFYKKNSKKKIIEYLTSKDYPTFIFFMALLSLYNPNF